MKYMLSDKDLLQLSLLMPISEIRNHFPQYCPPLSTIYKRLKKHNIGRPAQIRKDFERSVFKAGANEMIDEERYIRLQDILASIIEETIEDIHKKAARYEEMTR